MTNQVSGKGPPRSRRSESEACPRRAIREPYRNRRACAGNTNCIPICPIQAKYDPTITLNDAMDTGFVTISGPDRRQRDRCRRKRRHQPRSISSRYKNRDAGRTHRKRLRQGQDLRHRRQRNRDPTTAADVEQWRPDRQGRRQQQRYGRAKPDGSSLLRRLGDVGQAALPVSRPADHVGYRRSLRWPVSSRARRFPRRYRQRGLEFRGRRRSQRRRRSISSTA